MRLFHKSWMCRTRFWTLCINGSDRQQQPPAWIQLLGVGPPTGDAKTNNAKTAGVRALKRDIAERLHTEKYCCWRQCCQSSLSWARTHWSWWRIYMQDLRLLPTNLSYFCQHSVIFLLFLCKKRKFCSKCFVKTQPFPSKSTVPCNLIKT